MTITRPKTATATPDRRDIQIWALSLSLPPNLASSRDTSHQYAAEPRATNRTAIHHGTLILKLNERMMDGSLKRVKERKYPRLTSVEESLGYVPERKKIAEAFEKGFSGLR